MEIKYWCVVCFIFIFFVIRARRRVRTFIYCINAELYECSIQSVRLGTMQLYIYMGIFIVVTTRS